MRLRIIVLFIALGILIEPTLCWSENEEYLSTFEIVWNKVNETYFDPTFGGLDWKDVHDRFQPRITAAKEDKEFYELINNMLWELKVSRANLISPGSFALHEPVVFAEGSPGIDIRLLNGAAVITFVKPDSPADKAGLCPGYVIEAIDGISVEQIAKDAERNIPPPNNSRCRIDRITKRILSRIYGAPETEVSIVYSDKGGEGKEKKILRAKRSGVAVGPKGMFFIAIEFELNRGLLLKGIDSQLDSAIRYIEKEKQASAISKAKDQMSLTILGVIFLSAGACCAVAEIGTGKTMEHGTFWFGLIDDVRIYNGAVTP